MNDSFSSVALASTVAQILAGTRDLTSASLEGSYAPIPGARRNLDTRYEAVSNYRTTSGLPEVPGSRFSADQGPSGGGAMFLRVQNGQGIETTFTEDLVTSDVSSLAPDHLAAFIAVESKKVASDTNSLETKLAFSATPASLHLTEDDQTPTADDDTDTYRRMQGMFAYTRSLIK